MIKLHGIVGAIILLAFLVLWAAAMWFAVMMRKESKGAARLFMVPPPGDSLSQAGLVWRQRYFVTLALAALLFVIAAIVQ